MADPVADLSPQLEAKVAAFVKQHRLPGAAAGVIHADELAWSGGHGFADLATERVTDARTLYRIASITKTFTATAVMQLRDDGALRLDDPLVAHLPELKAASDPFGPIEDVTIRRLLTHESGLMGDPVGTDWGLRTYPPVEETLAHPERIRVVIPPDSASKYSNLGFRLLGEVIARRSGTSYTEYVHANILGPLGLESTAFEPSGELAGRRATGYDERMYSDDLRPAAATDLRTAGAEGGLWSCVEDLARWTSFQFRTGAPERGGAQVLAGPSLAEMHRMRVITDEAWTDAFGLAFYGVRKGEQVYIGHSGGFFGFTSDLRFHPGSKTGAIVLLNGDAGASVLCVELAELARDAAEKAAEPARVPAPMPESYAALLGLYVLDGLADLFRIEWRDAALTVVNPRDEGEQPTLEPTGEPDTFLVRKGRDAGEPAVFLRTAEGRVCGARIATTTMMRLDPVWEA